MGGSSSKTIADLFSLLQSCYIQKKLWNLELFLLTRFKGFDWSKLERIYGTVLFIIFSSINSWNKMLILSRVQTCF